MERSLHDEPSTRKGHLTTNNINKPKARAGKASNLPENHHGGLPVPANKTALPALDEHDALAEDLAHLTKAVEWICNPWAEYNHFLVDAKEPGMPRGQGYWREQLRVMLPGIPKTRALWARLDRPATNAEIPAEVYRLVVSMTTTGTIDQDIFIETLADDVSALRPTIYELKRACHAVRTTCEYLSIKAVIDAIKREKRRSKTHARSATAIRSQKDGW